MSFSRSEATSFARAGDEALIPAAERPEMRFWERMRFWDRRVGSESVVKVILFRVTVTESVDYCSV